MLEDAVEEVLRPGGLLSAELPHYESRPEQLAMALRVARALENDERLLVEAGTGTGKTLAYLVPAILSGPQGGGGHRHQDACRTRSRASICRGCRRC